MRIDDIGPHVHVLEAIALGAILRPEEYPDLVENGFAVTVPFGNEERLALTSIGSDIVEKKAKRIKETVHNRYRNLPVA